MCTSFKNRCVAVILAAVLLFSTLPFGSFRVFAEGAGQLSTDIGTKMFRVGASEEFTFTTTAGDDAGTMVKGRFTFSDPDALEKLEYLESKNGEWYEFYGDFGPETGFPLIDGTSRFRATFQKAGTYTVSAQMVRVDDDSVVCQTEAQVQVVCVNGTLTTDLSEKTFKLHEATEFTFTTTAGDDAGTMVKGRFTFSDPAALEKLEYLESKNGEWYEFSGDFGPETGFPLINGTSRFRAIFQKAGTYTVSAQMVRVDDDSVVCETTANINVAWNAAQLKTDIDKKNLVYGQKTEYTYTTVAGDDAGTMVKGRFTFSDPDALETLEYYEVMDGKWYPLNGEFGPSAGFPLSDATSRFRATFKKAGTFTCTVEIYSVKDQTVLCKDTTEITVQKAELTGISVVGTNNNYDGNEFELVKITGCEQGDKVSYWVNGEEETDTPPKRSAIGSYEVRVVVTRDENHASYEATVASMIWGTIDPGSGLIVQGTYCIYDGKPHDVVTVTRADGEGDYTLKYRMEGEGEDDWRTEIPQVTDAGSYTVYVKATKENYNDLKVEVKPAEGAEYPFNVCIAKAEQNLVFVDGETIEKTWSEDSESNKYTNAVSGGKTEEKVKYSAVADEMSNGSPCAEINEETGEVTFYGAGTVQVTATKEGDDNYKDAEISYTLTIKRAAQAELRIASSVSSEFTYNENGNKIELSTTGGSGDGAVTYGIQASPADCVELEGDMLTVRKSGVVQVTATKEKTDTYKAAQSEAKEITIQKATQSIAFEATPGTVIYGTAYKNVAEPVEVSQAADRKGYAENTGITYKVIEGEEIASVEKDGSLSWKDGSVGKLTVQAIKAGNDCYEAASAEYTVTVAYAQLPEAPYTIEGTRAEGSQGDWYIGDVTITPAEGYSISETKLTDESKWSTGLVITEEGTTEKTIYLRNNEDLGITDEITISNIQIDKTAPTNLQISYKTSLLDTILSVGSLGFYDAPVEVTVSASDDVAPVCEFVITYGDEQKTVKKEDAGFSEGKTASATITINPQFRGKVSFTAMNEAGLCAASNQEKEPTIVVDNIAPNVAVKYDNYEVENGSYYKMNRTATIQIAEENFFPEAMTEKRSDDATYLKIAVTRVDDNGKETTTNYTDETLTFTKKGNVWEAELSFTENGDYTFVVDYMDFSKNYDGKESHYETSFTIDKEPPKISVTPNNKQYLADDFSAELQIIEHNFNAADVELTEGNDSLKNYADYIKDEKNWTSDGNTHTLKLSIEKEAHYIGKVVYRDKAGNPQECEVDFALDKTAPTNLQISYDTSPLDTILSVGSLGFYDAPVEVTVSASDDVAPVCEFVITYGDEQKTVKKEDAGFSEGKTASATITINPQFRGKVSFTAMNEAGLRAASNQEKEPTIVVDNIAPNVTVKYDNYEVENGSYYKTDRTATIQIAEENFFPEAMTEKRSDDTPYLKIAVTRVDDNGKKTTTNYTDETLTFTKKGNVWEAELSFTENGDYTFVVDYMDFSKNYDGEESRYKTSFTIDKTDPVIVVTHENNDAVNDFYFKADRPVKVEITEHNFDPAKVDLTVMASNANGEVADFAAYLKKADSWKTEGDKHTAEFTFETEADYTFDISVTDLAGRSNQGVSYGESVAPKAFTIDKTAPVIVVTHENNDAANDSYFKEDRPVKVGITERNFDPAKVDLTVTASNANGEVADFAAYLKKADSWKKDGNSYTAEFTFETEADYTFDISVTDLAERSNQDVSYGNAVAPTAFTIDKTDPVIVVTHENNDAVNDFYFKADRPVKVEITEHNFDPAKVDLTVMASNANGEVADFAAYLKKADSWKTEGDKHTAEFTFETEADYTFDISVTDLAGRSNPDVSYGNAVAPTAFMIDKTDPVIKVTHSNNSAKNGSYFKADRPVKVEITERNFDPAKVDLTVTASNANGVVADFAAYLKKTDSWKKDGNRYTAEFTFETEADYTFDISVTDLAERSNQGVSYGESVAPTAFTIDKTAPTDGEITIDGQSVRAENSLAFEKFYREAQSIKFTAKFDISGEHSIEYQKVTSLSAAPDEGKWLPYTNSVAAQPNERFVIYFRAEDRAGNVRVFHSTGIVVDDQAPVGEKNAPEIDILPQAGNGNGIHTADVAVSLRVVDPKYLGTTANEKDGYYSGLKEITYRIYAQDTGAEETGTLLRMGEKTVGNVTTENGLVSAWSGSINVSAGKFNSNYVFVEVTAVDNAGNKRITTVDSPIRIDTTAPRISVSYDNNNGDATFANGSTDAFFKEGRTATIVVTERNFDPALVALTLTNRTGATPVLSGWRTEQGSGNGDDTRHIATLYYGTDGEYNFGISCKDLAGLSSTAVSYQGLAPQRFTIDRTAPVISVVYDNMDAKNENYYKASRTATITITERNFEQSRLMIRLTATDHGEAIKAPEISAWSSSGDTHTATIRYDADALYSFDISYRDKAGNAADRYRGDTFYVDQTLPKVTLSGIADESANSDKGDIGFVLTATDTNLDEFTPVITAVLMEDGQIVKRELAVGESKPIEDGMEFVVKNLPDDGIYRITCTVTDKAGNAFEEITLYRKDGTAYTAKRTGADDLLMFSVNRSGSAYEMTSYTAALTEKYYVQRVTEEVAIVEINADPLVSYVVTLGGKELQEGTDYTVSIEGGSGDWRKYTYHVQSTLFDAEGEYNLVISSVDGAENDAFSDVKGASIHFVVDRTAPVVAVSGLAAGGRYQTTKQQVTLVPTDDGGALKSLRVLLVDDDGETLEELVNLQGEALGKALEENDGKITFELSEGLYQNVRIICDDCADYGDEENIIYDKVFRNVSVSSSAFMIFWANKPLRWGVIGGVSAVVLAALLVLLLKKRKKKD